MSLTSSDDDNLPVGDEHDETAAEKAEQSWIHELELLLDFDSALDFGTLRSMCRGRSIPRHLRNRVWTLCLNADSPDPSRFEVSSGDVGSMPASPTRVQKFALCDQIFDLPEQATIHDEAEKLIRSIQGVCDTDKVAMLSDIESIITGHCKLTKQTFNVHNGWINLLKPLLTLGESRQQVYSLFSALLDRYIPLDCDSPDGKPFHLFRLLLLYHDPELCSFLDTKKITSYDYSEQWFKSLFGGQCKLEVALCLLDAYLQQADPFLVFFLSLVMLLNAKETIVAMEMASSQQILDTVGKFPSQLEADDINDFCELAQHYASRTPQSFRKEYQCLLFPLTVGPGSLATAEQHCPTEQVSNALCLPVSVAEIVTANQLGRGEGVHYFIVDCRPAEQFNAGHLPTAFHLDANLMLHAPADFETAVEALFHTQKRALASGSAAGGNHLCFMGSGREQEDQYVHMVIANFLQHKNAYVSIAKGGYLAVHELLSDSLNDSLANHDSNLCLACCQSRSGTLGAAGQSSKTNSSHRKPGTIFTSSVGETKAMERLGKLGSAFWEKSSAMKEKLVEYIKNEPAIAGGRDDGGTAGRIKHVSKTDKKAKKYRALDIMDVFSISDEESSDSVSGNDEPMEVVSLDSWLRRSDIIGQFQASLVKRKVKPGPELQRLVKDHPGHIVVTDEFMFILKESNTHKGMATIHKKRPLESIMKITSKKNIPEIIRFQHGRIETPRNSPKIRSSAVASRSNQTSNEDEGVMVITDYDVLYIEEAGDCIKLIKQCIVKRWELNEEREKNESVA